MSVHVLQSLGIGEECRRADSSALRETDGNDCGKYIVQEARLKTGGRCTTDYRRYTGAI